MSSANSLRAQAAAIAVLQRIWKFDPYFGVTVPMHYPKIPSSGELAVMSNPILSAIFALCVLLNSERERIWLAVVHLGSDLLYCLGLVEPQEPVELFG